VVFAWPNAYKACDALPGSVRQGIVLSRTLAKPSAAPVRPRSSPTMPPPPGSARASTWTTAAATPTGWPGGDHWLGPGCPHPPGQPTGLASPT